MATRIACTFAALASLAAVAAAGPALAADKIAYPVTTGTMIMQSSPGSGGDLFLRAVADAANRQIGANFAVENVTGGSGAKAMALLGKSPGDGSMLMGVSPTYVNTSLLSKPPVSYTDLQPIVRLFLDSVIVVVREDSPYKTLKDVIEAAKKAPHSVKVAVGEPGGLETQTMIELMQKTGTQLTVISHDGGGDALLSVLNGTGDMAIGEAAELKSQLDAKQIRPIAAYTEARIATFPDLPTAREQGIDMVVQKFRGIIGPKNVSPEVIKAWEAAVPKMLNDPAFKKWYEEGALIPAFQPHDQFEAFIDNFGAKQKQFFLDNNMIKG
ncbi:tripartite tricarboxylate transporter substrate binding protein [Starkeya koreensis]|uniref:Tripartite tricarboxylate transporter substrate binding protein n=1 Tax=Ancylobacter koreensis TaxID=266121 RepID=A0ABT0DJH4_9HYPH|nr:tripartite tricarboxylate transporter substrate binding protein [Ancylobacter koreensis]MCK0207425.1 tripartite tricarboxylate transporter substrate binding protein [Ancylobacter koreensis]